MRFTIFWKILVLLLATILLISTAIFLTTNHFVTQSLDEQALDRLSTYKETVDMELQEITSGVAFINSVVGRQPQGRRRHRTG